MAAVLVAMAVERPWSAPTGPLLSPLAQVGIETAPLAFLGAPFVTIGSFQSGEAFAGRRALTIVSLLMSGCG